MKILSLILYFYILCFSQKVYKTNYYIDGKIKSKGWMLNGKMEDYWSFFYENGKTASKGSFNMGEKEGYWFYYDIHGKKTKEGHYIKNQPTKWWVYYYGSTHENCLYQADSKTRFCLTYENGKITKAKKYVNDVFLHQWSSINSFKHDNPEIKF